MPVLIAHEDQNVLIPIEKARIIKDRIPRAELHIIPGAGHLFLSTDPVEFQKHIVEFLK
jgi:pimeloyl-ACP methyl ester carboxylesterase